VPEARQVQERVFPALYGRSQRTKILLQPAFAPSSGRDFPGKPIHKILHGSGVVDQEAIAVQGALGKEADECPGIDSAIDPLC
jgi:hypothetical protein